jgi:hypothetical protein
MLGLAHTALKSSGNLLRHVTADAAGYKDKPNYLQGVLLLHSEEHKCILEIMILVRTNGPDTVKGLDQLTASPHLLPCVAATCATLTLRTPTMRKAAELGACSKGGTPSSNNHCLALEFSAATLKYAHSSWKITRQLLEQASPCQLKLFELLGMDAHTMLWFAQSKEPSMSWPNIWEALAGQPGWFSSSILRWTSQPRLQQQMPEPQRQLESQLLLLLSTVLMPYAVASHNSMAAVQAAVTMCGATMDAAVAMTHAVLQEPGGDLAPGISSTHLPGV